MNSTVFDMIPTESCHFVMVYLTFLHLQSDILKMLDIFEVNDEFRKLLTKIIFVKKI